MRLYCRAVGVVGFGGVKQDTGWWKCSIDIFVKRVVSGRLVI